MSATGYLGLGGACLGADRVADAEEAYRKALELAPAMGATRAYLSFALLAQGRLDEATATAAEEPIEVYRLWAAAILHDAVGRRAESEAALQELIAKYAGDAAAQIATVFAGRGEADAAFE